MKGHSQAMPLASYVIHLLSLSTLIAAWAIAPSHFFKDAINSKAAAWN